MRPDDGKKWWALAALNLAVLAAGMDGTVLSVALPTLATELHASESDLQWFQSGYLLVLAATMLPAGLLGDRYGRKKVILAALLLFGVGSAGCAYSPGGGAFIAARMVLGVAAAGVIVMALSALTVLFSERERGKAVGVWAAANFLAAPVGPILGGWMLTRFWWGWVFLINLPVAVIGFTAVLALVPESAARRRPGLDVVGVATSTSGLVTLTYGLIEAGEQGWTDVTAWTAMLAGLGLLAAFAGWELLLGGRPGGRPRRGGGRRPGTTPPRARWHTEPLVDPGLFRSRSYAWGVISIGIAVPAMIGVLFTMPQFFQGVRGADAMGSGLRLLPLIGGLLAGALPADRLARTAGAKLAVAAGFAVLALGLALGATTGVGSGNGFLAIWMALVGLGTGLAMATATSTALTELSADQSGIGSAVLQAVKNVGGPFGAAVLGSVLNSAYHARLNVAGLPAELASAARRSVFAAVAAATEARSAALLGSARAAFVHGMDAALVVSAGIAAAGMVLAIVFLPSFPSSRAVSSDTSAVSMPSGEADIGAKD